MGLRRQLFPERDFAIRILGSQRLMDGERIGLATALRWLSADMARIWIWLSACAGSMLKPMVGISIVDGVGVRVGVGVGVGVGIAAMARTEAES